MKVKKYAVLIDVTPTPDGHEYPTLIQADGTREDLEPYDFLQIVDGAGSVFHCMVAGAQESYSRAQARSIAAKYCGEVVEVGDFSRDVLRIFEDAAKSNTKLIRVAGNKVTKRKRGGNKK